MIRIRKQISAVLFGAAVMFSSMQQVGAEQISPIPAVMDTEDNTEQAVVQEETQEEPVEETAGIESAKDCAVQVIIEYIEQESGKSYILKSGSGFLISENVVLTDYSLLSLSDEEKAAAEVYLSTELGKTMSFTESEGAQIITTQLGVVMYRDVVVSAEINQYSSQEMRLGILNLSDSLNRSTAVFGDSGSLVADTELYSIGYRTLSVMNPGQDTERLTQRDVKVSQGEYNGAVDEANLIYLSHTAKISVGCDGGPTVDEDGLVVGMCLYGGFEDGSYRTLAVNEIKDLLENCEIPYQEAGNSSGLAAEILDARAAESVNADKELLDDYILNYSMIDKEDYTEESYALLEEALHRAREVKQDNDAAQEEVDEAVEQLMSAKESLVGRKEINYPFIITLSILILFIITTLVLYILKLKGIIYKKTESNQIVTLDEIPDSAKSGALKREPEMVIPKPRTSGRLGKGEESGGYKETTVLGVKAPAESEGTIVLGTQSASVEAYLIRTGRPEKIRIEGSEFLIGKDKGRVNYCIMNNPSISRCHAKIKMKDGKFYLSDMQSTNFTYLNGRILEYGEEAELKDGDSVRFSNEDYSVQIGKGD